MSTARSQARQLLAELAQKANETLGPDSAGRIQCATRFVLAGDVDLLPDGTALVASGSDPLTVYRVNGTCECSDFARAPQHWCKHKLARALAIRLSRALPPDPAVPAVSHTEAPCSANVHVTIDGRDVLVTMRGTTEGEVLSRVERLLAQYPVPAGAAAVPVCPYHGPLKASTKGKGWYCPSKMADGNFCKEKGA